MTRRWIWLVPSGLPDPLAANTHLFINRQDAARTGTAKADWDHPAPGHLLPGHPRGRILREAHATGGEVRRRIDMFGLSVEGAQRYTATVDPLIRELAA